MKESHAGAAFPSIVGESTIPLTITPVETISV